MLSKTCIRSLFVLLIVVPATARATTITHDFNNPATPDQDLVDWWTNEIFIPAAGAQLQFTGYSGNNNNQYFLDSFYIPCDLTDMSRATLKVTLAATPNAGMPNNDHLHLQVTEPNVNDIYQVRLGDKFSNAPFYRWNTNKGVRTRLFRLDDLLPPGFGSDNVISSINAAEPGPFPLPEGRLDVSVQDDTTVQSITLRYNCVPEPGTIALCGLGALFFMIRRSRA